MKTLRGLVNAAIGLLAVMTLAGAPGAYADVVTDANARAADVASRFPSTPIAVRMMAIVQVSVFEAVNAVTGRYPPQRAKLNPAPGASLEAAVASATRTALSKLMPAQQAVIDADYQALLGSVPDGPAKTAGIALGEQAATAIVALCADDGAVSPDVYRPHAAAGVYVPTVGPAVPHWGQRHPWVLPRGDHFRPGPPPALTSETWARDYNEIKAVGSRSSTQRTPEQTAMAKFWEATAPAVYWPVARSVASTPGRDVTDNARLLALAAMAMDDGLIAVFDDPQRRSRRQPRHRPGSGLDAVHRDPHASRVSVRPLHRVGGPRGGARDRDRLRAHAHAQLGQFDRRGCRAHVDQCRRLHEGGRAGAYLRRRALPLLDGGRLRDGQEDRRAGGEERAESDPLTAPSPLRRKPGEDRASFRAPTEVSSQAMDLRLGGKVVLVTGAGQGLGRAIGSAFAREGPTWPSTTILRRAGPTPRRPRLARWA